MASNNLNQMPNKLMAFILLFIFFTSAAIATEKFDADTGESLHTVEQEKNTSDYGLLSFIPFLMELYVPSEVKPQKTITNTTQSCFYQDETISFSCPDNFRILEELQPEGLLQKTITFMYWDEERSLYMPIGLQLKHPYILQKESHNRDTFNQLDLFYKNRAESTANGSEDIYIEKTFGEHRGFITADDFIGRELVRILYVEHTRDGNPRYVYLLHQVFSLVDQSIIDEVFDEFVETVEFY